MFDKTQYIIEEKVLPKIKFRESYDIKDVNGDLLGYSKKQRVKGGFWFESAHGTRLGEVREVSRQKLMVDRYEVYDDQNQLRGTIKPEKRSANEVRRFQRGIILLVAGVVVVVGGLSASFLLNFGDIFFIVGFFSGIVLAVFGLIYMIYMTTTGKLGMLKWNIQNSKGLQWAKAGQSSKFFAKYQIVTSDGSIIAQIHKERGLSQLMRGSYKIDISREAFDSLLILSYAVLMATRERKQTSMGYGGGAP